MPYKNTALNMHRLKLESCKQITIINNITVLSGDNCRIGDDITSTDKLHNYYALGCFVGYCILLATHIITCKI